VLVADQTTSSFSKSGYENTSGTHVLTCIVNGTVNGESVIGYNSSEYIVQLAIGDAIEGYTVTWGTVTTEFVGGSASVILNFFDGTTTSFVGDDIQNLAGTTHTGVVSIAFDTCDGGTTVSGYNFEIVGDFSSHNIAQQNGFGYGFSTEGSNFSGSHWTYITLTLGSGLDIISFHIWGED